MATGVPFVLAISNQASLPKLEWFQRDRPLVTLHHVCNVGQTEGLKLRSLQTAAPGVGGARRVEGLMKASGVRVEHVADDRDYYKGVVATPMPSPMPSAKNYGPDTTMRGLRTERHAFA